jgi:Core-2/I-Branching enzyme
MIKIAFLFLAVTDVYHQDVWRNFFNDSINKNQYSIYVHSKNPVPESSFFKKYEIPIKIPTSWKFLLRAETALLREALKDPDNKYFVYLSESTIPLQPFDFVYDTLTADSRSQFSYKLNNDSRRTFFPLKPKAIYKSSQWVILNRKHAELMAQDNPIHEAIARNAFDNEHYHSTYIVARKLEDEVNKRDHTLIFWPKKKQAHPYSFSNLTDNALTPAIIEAIVNKTHLFSRKFDKDCDLSPLKKYMPELLKD